MSTYLFIYYVIKQYIFHLDPDIFIQTVFVFYALWKSKNSVFIKTYYYRYLIHKRFISFTGLYIPLKRLQYYRKLLANVIKNQYEIHLNFRLI